MIAEPATLQPVAAPRRAGSLRRHAGAPTWPAAVARFLKKKPMGAFGAALIVLFLALALGAQWLAPYPYDVGTAADRLQGPSLPHPFGTDANGRDLLSRVIWGARVSVTIGFGAVAISTLVAVTVGVTSGYFGGWVDLLVQRLVDIWISFPALVLLVSLVAILGPGLWSTTLVLGILLAPGTARVVRSAVLAARIVRSYVLPNVSAAILVLATTQLGVAVLAESTLSFLGYGVPPPFPTWGSMLSGTGRAFMLQSPWLSIWPGLAISAAVFGFNMLGDALRHVLDPRLRGR
ncbi:MAG: ABC transporter permease [Chloroflexi bacterium]|nr:MAG: ABC transporter permease [Chloroflexota bacterium]